MGKIAESPLSSLVIVIMYSQDNDETSRKVAGQLIRNVLDAPPIASELMFCLVVCLGISRNYLGRATLSMCIQILPLRSTHHVQEKVDDHDILKNLPSQIVTLLDFNFYDPANIFKIKSNVRKFQLFQILETWTLVFARK